MSKHQEILDYLLQLDIGKRVSVRSISNYLNVSEGTAYRAIKEAEMRGIVETRPRSGTVRVKQKSSLRIAQISYAEIARISDCDVVAGKLGLNQAFSKFSIGAMTINNIKSYLVKGGLLIVGDRENIQLLALENKNAVLVTGGFSVSKKVKEVANRLGIPVMVTSYDTFTVATMINQALATIENIDGIKEVSQFYDRKEDYGFLRDSDSVSHFYNLFQKTGHVRFPIVDSDNNLVGIVSTRDVLESTSEITLSQLMTVDVVETTLRTPLVQVGQKMMYQDLTMLPVVTSKGKLVGVIQRRKVFENLPNFNEQPLKIGRDSMITLHDDGESEFFIVESGMLDDYSYLTADTIQNSFNDYLDRTVLEKNLSYRIKQLTLYHLNPTRIESCVILKSQVLQENKDSFLLEIEYMCDEIELAKIIVCLQLEEKK